MLMVMNMLIRIDSIHDRKSIHHVFVRAHNLRKTPGGVLLKSDETLGTEVVVRSLY